MATFIVMSTLGNSFKHIVAALVVLCTSAVAANAADAARLEELFRQLKEADASTYLGIERQIGEEWSKSGSAAIDLLVRRGQDAIDQGDYQTAVEHFSAAIDHAPDFAEAYNGRATAFYLLDEFGLSLEDIRQTLILEPRHFGALSGFAMILEQIDREDDALEVYRQILELAPAAPGINEAVERLELQQEGRTL